METCHEVEPMCSAGKESGAGTMKRCTTCGAHKPREQFNKDRAYCKPCHSAAALAWARANKEKRRAIANAYTKRRRAKLGPPKKGGGTPMYSPAERVIKMREWRKKWEVNNPHKVAQKTRMYQAAKLNSVPAWANRTAMAAFYAEARRITEATGIKHEVDHIVPLQSELVCGLHCEANMRVISKAANVAKLNRTWPDMP